MFGEESQRLSRLALSPLETHVNLTSCSQAVTMQPVKTVRHHSDLHFISVLILRIFVFLPFPNSLAFLLFLVLAWIPASRPSV